MCDLGEYILNRIPVRQEIIENNIVLYHGECLDVMDILVSRNIKVDAIITDPPFGTTACKWDTVISFIEMWSRIERLRNEKTAVVLFGSEPFSSLLRSSNIKNFKYDWIWQKNNAGNFQLVNYQPLKKHEMISVFYPHYYYPQGLKECDLVMSNKGKAGKLGHLSSEKKERKLSSN